jgi:hypothetical protein
LTAPASELPSTIHERRLVDSAHQAIEAMALLYAGASEDATERALSRVGARLTMECKDLPSLARRAPGRRRA